MMNETSRADVLALLIKIARAVESTSFNLSLFAYSPDVPDQWVAEAVRADARCVVTTLVDCDATAEEIETARIALAWVCAGDTYAEKEIAGRFMSAIKRFGVIRAIKRHPRAQRFSSLVEAIGRGRYTAKQWAFAQALAAETTAAA